MANTNWYKKKKQQETRDYLLIFLCFSLALFVDGITETILAILSFLFS